MEMKARKSKKVLRRNRIIRIVAVIVIAAVLITAAVLFGRRRVSESFGENEADNILSAQVSAGSIVSTVYGTGTLIDDNIVTMTLPDGVETDQIYVESGDEVEEGDLIASVDTASVLLALSDIQSELDDLDAALQEASEDAVSDTLITQVAGRVKEIYAEEGDDVSGVMEENGALLVLSLDGQMQVQIEADGYEAGDLVTVVSQDGVEYEGMVSGSEAGIVTILTDDDGPKAGETVTVDGNYTGTLSVHEPLKITGYAGTVSSVEVSENESVSEQTVLFELTDTSYSANYTKILSEREEVEETYEELIALYREGAVYAESSGVIGTVPEDSDSGSQSSSDVSSVYSMAGMSETSLSGSSSETNVFTIYPNESMSVTISVDESDILSVETGQEVSVTIESIGEDAFDGTVTEIDTTASASGGVTTYSVTVTIDKTEEMMEGMTAEASITIEGVEDALILPKSAVRNTSTSSYVYTTMDESTGELGGMVEVVTGLSNGTYIEITEGLTEGTTVYYTSDESGSILDLFGNMRDSGFSFGGMDSGGGFPLGGGSDSGFGAGGGISGGFGGQISLPGN